MRRRLLKIARWLALVMLLGVLAGGALWFFPQRVLTVDSGAVTGDVLVVLGGGLNADRARHAAELYHAGVAPWILCTGRGDCESNAACLRRHGVPASAILSEDRSANTSENARFSLPILRQLGAKRVIIVTSWYHSRRAWHVFRHYAPDLVVYSCPSYEEYSGSPAQSHEIRHRALLEYLKLPGYLLHYGVSPI